MRFVIHIGSHDVRAALVRLLDAWRSLTCSSMELFDWTPDLEPAPGILFWDLDDGPPPAVLHRDEALVLCSSSSRAAISSYAIHPAGFLRKPIRMPEFQAVLHRCVDFWWDSLERLEIVSDRCRFRLPLYDVVWAESARRGCLIHSSRAAIPAHEPLASLESRLARPIFLRCQRGFLVNLCHVRRLDTLGFHMSDGAVVPLSRNSRAGAAERYRQLCLLRHGETGKSEMRELWVAVCDDLEEERLSLARMIRSWARSRGLSVQIRSFSSGEELLNACRQPELYQFVFLDIFMPGLSGIETARRLRASGCNMSIIYATTSVDHGMESFETRAADYLVKPFREEDVARALDWCLEHLPERLRTLPIYAEGEWLELPLSSIRYIEVLDHHCQIHTLRQTVVARRGLDDLEAAISSGDFLRCHRSFLVNMNHIQGMEDSDFRMSDGALVPISAANRVSLRSAFIDWTYRKAWEQP